MTRVSTLWHLQTIDQERDEKSHRVEHIDRTLANNPHLNAARTALETEQSQLGRRRTELQDAELHAKTVEDKIKELESRLSSGRVTNPKELDSLEKDRQMYLRQRGDLDTRLLELMDAIESAQKDAEVQAAVLKKTQSSSEHEAHKLGRERDALAARIAELETERAKTRAALDPDALAAYDRLRQSKSGRALSRLKSGACTGCGVQVPSGLVSRIDEGEELVFCPGCGRILAP